MIRKAKTPAKTKPTVKPKRGKFKESFPKTFVNLNKPGSSISVKELPDTGRYNWLTVKVGRNRHMLRIEKGSMEGVSIQLGPKNKGNLYGAGEGSGTLHTLCNFTWVLHFKFAISDSV